MCFSIVFFGTFIFFPESPIFLLNKNKIDDADKALQVYRNSRRISSQKSAFYQSELDKLNGTKEDGMENAKVTFKDFRTLLQIGFFKHVS